jgi:hypothetical protein
MFPVNSSNSKAIFPPGFNFLVSWFHYYEIRFSIRIPGKQEVSAAQSDWFGA